MVYTNFKKKKKTYQQENKQAIKQKTGRKNQQKKNVTWYEYHQYFIIGKRQNRKAESLFYKNNVWLNKACLILPAWLIIWAWWRAADQHTQ